MKCTFENCDLPKYCKGYCVKHYRQAQRGVLGKIEGRESTKDRRGSASERFAKSYDVMPSGCWHWKTINTNGRANGFMFEGRIIGAYVASYILHKGPVGSLWVCHTCDNGLCVNPDHLFLGAPVENTQDMIEKGRQVIKRGEARGRVAKLTEAQVREIKTAILSGTRLARLAEEYGVSRCTISDINLGKTWSHV
jgi:hypothetical protein